MATELYFLGMNTGNNETRVEEFQKLNVGEQIRNDERSQVSVFTAELLAGAYEREAALDNYVIIAEQALDSSLEYYAYLYDIRCDKQYIKKYNNNNFIITQSGRIKIDGLYIDNEFYNTAVPLGIRKKKQEARTARREEIQRSRKHNERVRQADRKKIQPEEFNSFEQMELKYIAQNKKNNKRKGKIVTESKSFNYPLSFDSDDEVKVDDVGEIWPPDNSIMSNEIVFDGHNFMDIYGTVIKPNYLTADVRLIAQKEWFDRNVKTKFNHPLDEFKDEKPNFINKIIESLKNINLDAPTFDLIGPYAVYLFQLFTSSSISQAIAHTYQLMNAIGLKPFEMAKGKINNILACVQTCYERYVGNKRNKIKTILTESWSENLEKAYSYGKKIITGPVLDALRRVLVKIAGMKLFNKELAHNIFFVFGKPEKSFSLTDTLDDIIRCLVKLVKFGENLFYGKSVAELLLAEDPIEVVLARAQEVLFFENCYYLGSPVPGKIYILEAINRAQVCIRQIEVLKKNLHPKETKVLVLGEAYNKLRKMEMELKQVAEGHNRPAPIGVILYSTPGVGKSLAISYISAIYAMSQGIVYHDGIIFHKSKTSDYQEGYDPFSQHVYHMSELGNQTKQLARAKGDDNVMFALSLIDGQPMLLDMAFEGKGKNYAHPGLVVIDTNNPGLNLDELVQNKAAFDRRFLTVEMVVKPEFRKGNTQSLDSEKSVNSTEHLMDRWHFSVTRHVAKDNRESEPQYLLRNGDIGDFTILMARLMKTHIDTQEKLLARSRVEMDPKDYIKRKLDELSNLTVKVPRLDNEVVNTSNQSDVIQLNDMRASMEDSHARGHRIYNEHIVTESSTQSYNNNDVDDYYTWFRSKADVNSRNASVAPVIGDNIRNDRYEGQFVSLEGELSDTYKKANNIYNFFKCFFLSVLWALLYFMLRLLWWPLVYVPFFDYIGNRKIGMFTISTWINVGSDYVHYVMTYYWKSPPVKFQLVSSFYMQHQMKIEQVAKIVGVTLSILGMSLGAGYVAAVAVKHLTCKRKILIKDKNGKSLQAKLNTSTGFFQLAPAKCAEFVLDSGKIIDAVWNEKTCVYEINAEIIEAESNSVTITSSPVILNLEDRVGATTGTIRIPIKNVPEHWNVQEPILYGGSHTGDIHSLNAHVMGNVRRVIVGQEHTHALGLKGNVCLVNTHALPKFPFVLKWLEQEKTSICIKTLVDETKCIDIGNDRSLITLSGKQFQDITMHLTEDWSLNANIKGVFADKQVIAHFDNSITKLLEHHATKELIHTDGMWEYSHPTHRSGDCGLPLLIQNGKTSTIAGIHAGGKDSSGYAVGLKRKDILAGIEKLHQKSKLMSIASEGNILTESLVTPNAKSPFRYEVLHGLRYYGSVQKNICMNNRSNLKNTKLSQSLPKMFKDTLQFEPQIKYMPPAMKPFWRDGKFYSPYNIGLKSMSQQRGCLNPLVMHTVIESLTDKIIKTFEECDVKEMKPLTLQAAINGVDVDPFIRRVNTSTSAGYGLQGKKFKHLPMIDEANCVRGISKDLLEKIEHDLNEYLNERTARPFCSTQLKDEPRDSDKVLDGKTRLFFMSSMHQLVIARMFLAPFFARLVECGHIFGSRVGINPFKDSQSLYDTLKEHSDRIVEGDYKNYDHSVPFDVRHMATTIIFNVCKHFGYNEDALLVLKGVLTDMLFPIIEMNGDIFQCAGLQPSGAYATAEMNTLCGLILLMYYWYDVVKDKNKEFFKCVIPCLYGDDVLASILESYKHIFNNIKYAEYCERVYHMKFTPASKNTTLQEFMNLEDCTFLKRSFRFHEELQRVTMQLSLESLYKSLDWTIPSNSVSEADQMFSTCTSFLWELLLHVGKQKHDELRVLLEQLLSEHYFLGEKVHLPTFESISVRL